MLFHFKRRIYIKTLILFQSLFEKECLLPHIKTLRYIYTPGSFHPGLCVGIFSLHLRLCTAYIVCNNIEPDSFNIYYECDAVSSGMTTTPNKPLEIQVFKLGLSLPTPKCKLHSTYIHQLHPPSGLTSKCSSSSWKMNDVEGR